MNQPFKCIKCGQKIDPERVEGLIVLDKQPHEFTCISCAPNNFVRAIWSGESGNSALIFADSIGEKDGIERIN